MKTQEEIDEAIEELKRAKEQKKVDLYLGKKFRYLACDPDVRKAAYAIVDEKGGLVDSWTVSAKSIEHSALIHGTEPARNSLEADATYVLGVESQQYYGSRGRTKDDDDDNPESKVKSLLQLARACGVSMSYITRIFPQHESLKLVLPRIWSKGRPKHVNQYWTISSMGLTPVAAGGTTGKYVYAKELLHKHTQIEQKHIMDAVAIAQHIRIEHPKQMKLKKFQKEINKSNE